ncbi:HNH endonuclease [Chryseobacterium sp. BIGb0232]|uniref:HNH endonuclease n=1 Tax=Chryseobacterium sp. BIGb0232 TaxID=2940598 RepID=UPI000F462A67|nr:HNH endonuclease [Chryseobacterium sp. BIGb0232]MCS4300614.1 5-methylcytosine-specific restriction protein A [Chryseobacterium sp. BIGb0232]ROS20500.1 5-methylcytosine-specific restriction protein A [Chryseobacterium nakagawai]
MNEIKTTFDAKLSYGYDSVTHLEGLILDAGGGGRYKDHTILFRHILDKLKTIKAHNITIYVAAKPTAANSYPDNDYRRIRFEDQTEFNFETIDLDRFKSNANDEIREKGKVDPEKPNGAIHKRLLITSNLNENHWNELFGNVSTEQIENDEFINSKNEEELQYTLQKIKKRLRQSQFRKDLLKAYDNTCAISRSKVLSLLEAAHIQPYNGIHTSVVTNGILLRSDIHDLFDIYLEGKRLINISADYKIEVHSSLKDSEYWEYNGKYIKLPTKGNYPIF